MKMSDEITEICIKSTEGAIQIGIKNKEIIEKFKTIKGIMGGNLTTEICFNNITITSENKKNKFIISANDVAYTFFISKEKE
jgi:hypothetical protein